MWPAVFSNTSPGLPFGYSQNKQTHMNWSDEAGRLYAILDLSCFSAPQLLFEAADELVAAGVTLIQYRNKSADAPAMLGHARELKARGGWLAKLIMNDRADLCVAAQFDGVHLGQDDLSPASARKIIGSERWLGV